MDVSGRGKIVRAVFWVCLLTVLFEGITAFFRFGLGWEATRDTKRLIAPLTGQIRIHHAYIGLAMLPFAAALRKKYPVFAFRLLVFGAALFLSDMIHHFCVLKPLTGNSEFYLVYPD